MFMTGEQKSNLVMEGEIVSEVRKGRTKYGEMTETVVRADDGKLYRIDWVKGGTDYQEDEFYDGDVPEVQPFHHTVVKNTTSYLTSKERGEVKSFPEIAAMEVDSFCVVTGSRPHELVSDEIIGQCEKILEMLPSLKRLDLLADAGAWREATEQYLTMIIALGAEKNE